MLVGEVCVSACPPCQPQLLERFAVRKLHIAQNCDQNFDQNCKVCGGVLGAAAEACHSSLQ